MKTVVVTSMDRGLAYGEACFETFRVIDAQVFDWSGHWQRLRTGLAAFGLHVPAEQGDALLQACLQQAAACAPDTLLRLTVSGGEARWGLMARAAQLLAQIQCAAYQPPAASAPVLRLQDWPFPLRKKTAKFSADYSDTLRALAGHDDAHVLFTQANHLIATATANILIYRHGQWYTPPATAGVLPGRVRAFLLQRQLIQESDCPLAWLQDCASIATCNSGQFIQPVGGITGLLQRCDLPASQAAVQPLMKALQAQTGVR